MTTTEPQKYARSLHAPISELFGEKTKSSTATIWRRMGREGEK